MILHFFAFECSPVPLLLQRSIRTIPTNLLLFSCKRTMLPLKEFCYQTWHHPWIPIKENTKFHNTLALNTMHKERKDSLVNTWRNEDKNSHNKSTSRLLFYIVYIYVYICIKISWRIQVQRMSCILQFNLNHAFLCCLPICELRVCIPDRWKCWSKGMSTKCKRLIFDPYSRFKHSC